MVIQYSERVIIIFFKHRIFFVIYFLYLYILYKIPPIDIQKLLSKETFKPRTCVHGNGNKTEKKKQNRRMHTYFHRFHFLSLSIDLSNDDDPRF